MCVFYVHLDLNIGSILGSSTNTLQTPWYNHKNSESFDISGDKWQYILFLSSMNLEPMCTLWRENFKICESNWLFENKFEQSLWSFEKENYHQTSIQCHSIWEIVGKPSQTIGIFFRYHIEWNTFFFFFLHMFKLYLKEILQYVIEFLVLDFKSEWRKAGKR